MSLKITDTIRQDLEHQIKAFHELPFKLTLESIANYYSVSLTPVKQVIDTLIEENIITKKANGRLERAKKRRGRQPAIKKPSINPVVSINNKLEDTLTGYIVQLNLQNHEGYLREEATAKKYNTGRTVVRQVFSRLAGAGLIEHVPRCGWKVQGFREKDMLDYLEIRETFEVKALKLARPNFVKEELEYLLEKNVCSNNPKLVALDNNLHNYWIKRCDNRYIQDFFTRHSDCYNALFDYAALGNSIKTEMAQEHRDILENLIAKKWRLAEQALIKHIRDQKKNVFDLVEFTKQKSI